MTERKGTKEKVIDISSPRDSVLNQLKTTIEYTTDTSSDHYCNWIGWLKDDKMTLYARIGFRYLPPLRQRSFTLDLASFTVIRCSEGTFTRFLLGLLEDLKTTKIQFLYIENVHDEERFGLFLSRQGFNRHGDSYPFSYYLEISHEQE